MLRFFSSLFHQSINLLDLDKREKSSVSLCAIIGKFYAKNTIDISIRLHLTYSFRIVGIVHVQTVVTRTQ